MKKIVLISCASKKLNKRAKARNIYNSQLFRYNLAYAESLTPDKIFILSAKHGLLDLDKEIDPYEKTLNKMPKKGIEKWANEVVEKLREVSDLDKDELIFLAGERYRKFIAPKINNYKIPLKGLGIGKQLKFFKEE